MDLRIRWSEACKLKTLPSLTPKKYEWNVSLCSAYANTSIERVCVCVCVCIRFFLFIIIIFLMCDIWNITERKASHELSCECTSISWDTTSRIEFDAVSWHSFGFSWAVVRLLNDSHKIYATTFKLNTINWPANKQLTDYLTFSSAPSLNF